MPRFVRSATARWDTHLDPTGLCWVVDVHLSDGTYETYVPPPRFYHAPPGRQPGSDCGRHARLGTARLRDGRGHRRGRTTLTHAGHQAPPMKGDGA